MQPHSCFSHPVVQAIHRYVDMVLLLLIAALAWWFVGLDRRVEVHADRLNKALIEASGVSSTGQSRHEALLKRLDQIDQRLIVIDQRFYMLFGKQGGGMIP